jgi:hypothetical protein
MPLSAAGASRKIGFCAVPEAINKRKNGSSKMPGQNAGKMAGFELVIRSELFRIS